MKTIVIPSNCGPTCINQVKTVLDIYGRQKVRCIFLQVRLVPQNHLDLMMLRQERSRYNHFDASFHRAIDHLKKAYSRRLEVVVDYIYGDSPAVFRNYVQHREADLVIYDRQEWQDRSEGLDIFRMVKRCGCELMYIAEGKVHSSVKARLGEVGKVPSSVLHHFNTVEQRLNQMQMDFAPGKIISKRISNLSRYFLNETALEKMLVQADGSLLLLKNK